MASIKQIESKNGEKGLDYVNILGIKVNSTSKEGLLMAVQEKLSRKIQFFIVTPNPEIVLQAQSNPDLAHSLNSADFSLSDGVGLRLANMSLRVIKGREFMLDLFRLAEIKKLKIYILGATREVNARVIDKVGKEFPNIKVKGRSGPRLDERAEPVSEVDTKLQFGIFKEINSFSPDLLFVAFGAPKQEIWINRNCSKLNAKGIMVVGGALDYYSGVVRPVPLILEKIGLEWLWRLAQEPKRVGRIFNAIVKWPLTILLTSVKN